MPYNTRRRLRHFSPARDCKCQIGTNRWRPCCQDCPKGQDYVANTSHHSPVSFEHLPSPESRQSPHRHTVLQKQLWFSSSRSQIGVTKSPTIVRTTLPLRPDFSRAAAGRKDIGRPEPATDIGSRLCHRLVLRPRPAALAAHVRRCRHADVSLAAPRAAGAVHEMLEREVLAMGGDERWHVHLLAVPAALRIAVEPQLAPFGQETAERANVALVPGATSHGWTVSRAAQPRQGPGGCRPNTSEACQPAVGLRLAWQSGGGVGSLAGPAAPEFLNSVITPSRPIGTMLGRSSPLECNPNQTY